MPATAGRVRMPANNRVHSSAALQTHGIWQSAIGYDPYAPTKDDAKNSSDHKSSNAEPEPENAYASFQELLALARVTVNNVDEARGACKKCGRVGHLAFQCRNFLSIKDDIKDKDQEAMQAAVLSGLEKIKGNGKRVVESEEESEEEESETTDSEVDSDIERIIAQRYGKKSSSNKVRLSSRKKKKDSDEDGLDSDSGERKKRGRSKKRRNKKRGSSDTEDDDEARRKRRREKRRKRDDSSEEEEERRRRKRKSRKEKRRRRSHRYSDDSDSCSSEDSGGKHKRKSRKAASPSDSDVNSSDDSRVGRGAKRSERSRKRYHEDE